jgi:cytoskeleton protein RodZ
MSSIGETLRRERQKRNLELDQISRDLKISSRFLQAIEEDHFDQLPAGVFAKSFVRQYARLLGLDAEELVAEMQRTLNPEPPPGMPLAEPPRESLGTVPELNIGRGEEWERVGDRRNWSSSLPSFALVVVVMLVCSGLYAFWQRERHPAAPAAPVETAKQVAPQQQAAQQAAQGAAPAEKAPSGAPLQEQAQTPAQQTQAAAPSQHAGAQPAVTPPAAQPAVQAPAVAGVNPPAPAAAGSIPAGQVSAAQPAQEAAADRAAQPAPGGSVKVEISAAEPVWVLARADGKFLFSGTLDANQTKTVEANGTVVLRVGNAGGLNITLNGKPIGPLGPKGQVRDVQFTSGGFQIVAAPKPPSPPPGE